MLCPSSASSVKLVAICFRMDAGRRSALELRAAPDTFQQGFAGVCRGKLASARKHCMRKPECRGLTVEERRTMCVVMRSSRCPAEYLVQVFTKGDDFRGIIFAKFADKSQRGDAVSVLRRARCQQDGKDVRAKPDLPFEERTMRHLAFGAKRVMTDWGYDKVGLWADHEKGTLSLGGKE